MKGNYRMAVEYALERLDAGDRFDHAIDEAAHTHEVNEARLVQEFNKIIADHDGEAVFRSA